MFKALSLITLFVTTAAHASPEYDKWQELSGISLKSGKENSVRTYSASTHKTLPYSMDLVRKGLTNFGEKCNNDYKDKRKYISESYNCRYHDENSIETFKVTDIHRTEDLKKFKEVYLLGRQIYNRGSYGHYELVTVQETKNEKGQRVVSVSLRMLNDKEVSLYTTPKFERETSFDSSVSTYTLTEISPNETDFTLEYNALTDHWLLNKEISVPQVFAGISKDISDLVKTVEEESSFNTRDIASK